MNEQNWKNKFNSFSQVATTRITQLLVIALSISIIYKDAWFVDFGASQYLTFQKEVFPTFEEFILSHKVYFKNNSTFDVCRKDIIVFNLPNGISKCIGDVLYVPKLVKNMLLVSQLIEQGFKVEFEATKCLLKSFD
jgi:hypothetical protein